MEQTQAQILKHHGGDAEHALKMITQTYQTRHDEAFWNFWQSQVATHYAAGDVIVDLGAGIGQFIKDCATRYPASEVVGIDAAPYMLDKVISLPSNAKMLADDLHKPSVEVADNTAGMVMANMVVHELTQPIKMFKAAYEWLKPGGRLCVIDVVRQPLGDYLKHRYSEVSPWDDSTAVEDLDDAFEHFLEHNRYHPEDIVFMLEQGGFKLIDLERQRNRRFVRLVVEK